VNESSGKGKLTYALDELANLSLSTQGIGPSHWFDPASDPVNLDEFPPDRLNVGADVHAVDADEAPQDLGSI